MSATCRSSLKIVARNAMHQPPVTAKACLPPCAALSECIDAAFAGTYAYGLLDGSDEDFPVAYLAGESRLDNGINGCVDHGCGQHDLDPYRGQEIDQDRKSVVEGKRGVVRVDPGGRGIKK